MTTISPFKDGARISIAQGVLRGVGPMGPRGFTGPAGPRGEQGPQGEQSKFEPVSSFYSRTGSVAITNDSSWQRIGMSTAGYNVGNWTEMVTASGAVRVFGGHPNGIGIMASVMVQVAPAAGLTETFSIEIGLFESGSGSPFASSTFNHTKGSSSTPFSFSAQHLLVNEADIEVGVRVFGSTQSPVLSFASLSLANTGGAAGPQGNQGPAGPQGIPGPIGPPGDANSGFGSFNSVAAGNASDTEVAGGSLTEQSMPYPVGTLAPHVPYFMRALAEAVSKRVVRRFSDADAMGAAADKEVGQLAFLSSNKSLRLVVDSSEGAISATVAQVAYGTGQPAAGTYPAGTIYLQVV